MKIFLLKEIKRGTNNALYIDEGIVMTMNTSFSLACAIHISKHTSTYLKQSHFLFFNKLLNLHLFILISLKFAFSVIFKMLDIRYMSKWNHHKD